MTSIVQMSCIIIALEVFLTKACITNFDNTIGRIIVQNRNVILFAYLFNNLAYSCKTWAINIPWCDITYLSLRTLRMDITDKQRKRITKHKQRIFIVVNLSSIVVTGNNQNIVGRRIHELSLGIKCWSTIKLCFMSSVESNAGTIFPIIIILHSHSLRHFIVPCLLFRCSMVSYIRVANDINCSLGLRLWLLFICCMCLRCNSNT